MHTPLDVGATMVLRCLSKLNESQIWWWEEQKDFILIFTDKNFSKDENDEDTPALTDNQDTDVAESWIIHIQI